MITCDYESSTYQANDRYGVGRCMRECPRIFKCPEPYSGKIELDETGDAYILKYIAFAGGTG